MRKVRRAVCRQALSRFIGLVSFFELALVEARFHISTKARPTLLQGPMELLQ